MLVTVTNTTSGLDARQIFVSMLLKTLEIGETSEAVSRTQSQLDAEIQLKQLVADGDASLAFTEESFDSSPAGFEPAPAEFSNATRPDAADVPTNTPIWNTDDNALNWSDGVGWRDASGTAT